MDTVGLEDYVLLPVLELKDILKLKSEKKYHEIGQGSFSTNVVIRDYMELTIMYRRRGLQYYPVRDLTNDRAIQKPYESIIPEEFAEEHSALARMMEDLVPRPA